MAREKRHPRWASRIVIVLAGIAITLGSSALAEEIEGEHFPAWMIDESRILRSTYPVIRKTAVCPSEYQAEGVKVFWDDQTTESMALRSLCGPEKPRGSWRTTTNTDSVTGDEIMLATLFGIWVGESDWLNADRPEFGIQCRDNTLGIWVYTGGHVGALRNRVPVIYAIGEEVGIEQRWYELISGSESSAGAWMPASLRGRFIERLRANPQGDFTIRVFGYDGAAVGTASFRLTGVERMVDPVLQECGW